MIKEPEELIDLIQCAIEREPGSIWTKSRLLKELPISSNRHWLSSLDYAITYLKNFRIIEKCGPGEWRLSPSRYFEGVLEVARSGAGFVQDERTGKSYRIDDVGDALPGDIVRVFIKGSDGARILDVRRNIERHIVGTVKKIGKLFYVRPLNPIYKGDISIDETKGAKDGDRVVVEVKNGDAFDLTGTITDVIGRADDPSLDTIAIEKEYDLPGAFPQSVIDEAERAPNLRRKAGERLDLTKEFILTIDPESARDYDDAISFSEKDGVRTLGVHIADVSFYVREGTELDKEAYERGTSIYLADKVIPMLPEQLSCGVCSLGPKVVRLCVSVFMDFDERGRCVARRFARSRIKSSLRLTYQEALAIIEGRGTKKRISEKAKSLLCNVSKLAQELRHRRMSDGALNIDVPECEVILDDDGKMKDIAVREYDISHQMIEECMIAANEAVATELSNHKYPLISRLHEPPTEDKLEELEKTLRTMHLPASHLTSPHGLQMFLTEMADFPFAGEVYTLVLRSMKRAVYSSEEEGHFGLAKRHYVHFTSPIRRYPDLIMHRILVAYLEGKPYSHDRLGKIALNSSRMETRADEASRALLKIKKYRFLEETFNERRDAEFDGIISKVTSFGLFVDIENWQIGGLIHISNLSNSYVRYEPRLGMLDDGNMRYRVGDHIRIRIIGINFDERKIDFAPALRYRERRYFELKRKMSRR